MTVRFVNRLLDDSSETAYGAIRNNDEAKNCQQLYIVLFFFLSFIVKYIHRIIVLFMYLFYLAFTLA